MIGSVYQTLIEWKNKKKKHNPKQSIMINQHYEVNIYLNSGIVSWEKNKKNERSLQAIFITFFNQTSIESTNKKQSEENQFMNTIDQQKKVIKKIHKKDW